MCPDDQWARFTVEESFGIEYADFVSSLSDLEDKHAFEEFIPSEYLVPQFATKFRVQYLNSFAGYEH